MLQRTSDPRREICSSRISLITIPGRRLLSSSPQVTRPAPGRRRGGGISPPRTRPGPERRRRSTRTGTQPPPSRPWRVSCSVELGTRVFYLHLMNWSNRFFKMLSSLRCLPSSLHHCLSLHY